MTRVTLAIQRDFDVMQQQISSSYVATVSRDPPYDEPPYEQPSAYSQSYLYMAQVSAGTYVLTCAVRKPVFKQHPNNASIFQSGRLWGHFELCFILLDTA